jgi:hypothetical protein
MFDILTLSEADLTKVLSKASTTSLARLVVAYPRAVGRTFMELLNKCLSAPTIEFLQEEMSATRVPTYPEIRQAESELMKIIHDEHLQLPVSSAPLARPIPQ